MIGSIGIDGSNYREYKTGPDLIVSFTQTDNILLWVTLDKGAVGLICLKYNDLVSSHIYDTVVLVMECLCFV